MSFVNFMVDDIWDEHDIVNRTEAMIRGRFTREEADILNRKVTGMILGAYQMTVEEMMEIGAYQTICELARDEGNAARSDTIILQQILLVEECMRRVAVPVLLPVEEEIDGVITVTNQIELDNDVSERSMAQATIDVASEDVTTWVLLRNPPEPEVDPLTGLPL
jgi:hypothetical protein